MASQIHVGDIGTAFQRQCLDQDGNTIDVSNALTMQITFVRPDNSRLTVTATPVTTGKDGWIQYVTQQATDLSIPGIYTCQVYLSWGSSPIWRSDITRFNVFPNE